MPSSAQKPRPPDAASNALSPNLCRVRACTHAPIPPTPSDSLPENAVPYLSEWFAGLRVPGLCVAPTAPLGQACACVQARTLRLRSRDDENCSRGVGVPIPMADWLDAVCTSSRLAHATCLLWQISRPRRYPMAQSVATFSTPLPRTDFTPPKPGRWLGVASQGLAGQRSRPRASRFAAITAA